MKLPIVGAAVLLSSCAASRTTIQSSWVDAAYSGPPLDRLAVVAKFDTRADSLAFERSASDYLATRGIATVPAHELLNPTETQTLDETQIRERLAATNVDGILIFRLVAIDERHEYQGPTPSVVNPPPGIVTGNAYSWYYRPSSNDYWLPGPSGSAVANGPQGYWIEQDFLVAETALFENRNDRLLWTARSETLDDARLRHTSESIVRSVARRLLKRDLIARTQTRESAPRALQQG